MITRYLEICLFIPFNQFKNKKNLGLLILKTSCSLKPFLGVIHSFTKITKETLTERVGSSKIG